MQEKVYKTYLLTVLMVVLAFNWVDRLALGLVLQEIKLDFHVSDTELGILSGFAFALFYSVMGIPIARWADRGDRVTIISLTAALWSVMVSLCGVAESFAQLLMIRVGVAIGEAGCIPPANSLIADYFTRAERPRAIAIYMLGGPLSTLIGYFLAGWLNELYGWRATFLILGAPGLFLAALSWFTLREPRRNTTRPEGVIVSAVNLSLPATEPPNFKEVAARLWANSTFRDVLVGYSAIYFFGYGIMQWQPTFFLRSYGIPTGELGTWLAVIYGLGGLLGTYLGGELASRLAADKEALQLRAMAVAAAIFGVLSILTYLSTNLYFALGLQGLAAVGLSAINGPLFATIHALVPQRMRATSISLIYLSANLIGMGLGPLAAGGLSDALRPWTGEGSLRYALLILCPGYFWAGWHMWRSSKTVAADLAAADTEVR